MGSLKPGASYVYESPDGGDTIYAREHGSNERKLIGYKYTLPDGSVVQGDVTKRQEDALWQSIRAEAKNNPALQKALDQCIIIYHLSKDKQQPPDWHPV